MQCCDFSFLTSLTSSCNTSPVRPTSRGGVGALLCFCFMTKTPIVFLPSGDMVKCELLCVLAQESAVTFSPELAG